MNFRRRPKENLEIPITPMIDVVFLLLIFFMVTTTFDRETALKIQLPEAEGVEQKQEEREINLTIDADGAYYVNNHRLADRQLETLKQALLAAAGKNRNMPFIISADAKTPHQAVMSALDVAAQIGLTHITFAAKHSSAGN
ncbi:MAG: ExbD/TolR family protein [Gammaproteobacteria bacterium]